MSDARLPTAEEVRGILCDHAWVTHMIEMPEGYSKPGVTLCEHCGVEKNPSQWTVTTTGATPETFFYPHNQAAFDEVYRASHVGLAQDRALGSSREVAQGGAGHPTSTLLKMSILFTFAMVCLFGFLMLSLMDVSVWRTWPLIVFVAVAQFVLGFMSGADGSGFSTTSHRK